MLLLRLVEVSHDGINELPALLLPENIILNIVVEILLILAKMSNKNVGAGAFLSTGSALT